MSFSIVMPYRRAPGRERLFFWTVAWWEANFPGNQLCIGDNADDREFNRSKARNQAFKIAGHDIVVVADADTIPDAGAVNEAIALVRNGDAPWALPYAEGRYYNLSQHATARILLGRPGPIQEPANDDDFEHQLTSVAGCLVLRRQDWATVGGYDERFTGWGGEDVAFAHCLDIIVGPHYRVDSHICHLWHPIVPASTFDGPQWAENGSLQRHYLNSRNPREVRDVRAL